MNFDACNGVIHVVKRGDTLYKLSRIYKVKLSDIISANPYINVYNMQPGDEVCIPVIEEEDFIIYTVKEGDTFEDILKNTGISPDDLFKLNPDLYKVALAENMEIFREFGFEIEEFGGREYKITAVPSDLFGIDVKELFIDILDNLNEPSSGEPKLISERIALRACKSAIKANMHMSAVESEKLISGLFELDDPYHCPHGRPVMISLSHYELDKKFKRIV